MRPSASTTDLRTPLSDPVSVRNSSTRSSSIQAWHLMLLCLLAVLFALISLQQGSYRISWSAVIQVLGEFDQQSSDGMIIWQLRLPRILAAILVGILLSFCGIIMQGLFRNPLADVSVIGVSSGAALGAGIAIVLLPSLLAVAGEHRFMALLHSVPVYGFAFVFALLTTYLTYKIGSNGESIALILLAGIAIGAFVGSMLGLLNYLADDNQLRDLTLWSMGSLASVSYPQLALLALTVLIILTLGFRKAQQLDVLLLGENEARYLGIDVNRLKRHCILLSALATAICIGSVGLIGFVGLVVPHMIRLYFGPSHRTLFSYALFLGPLLLLSADYLSRVIAKPAEVPIGILTALVGVPFFIVLILQQRQRLSL